MIYVGSDGSMNFYYNDKLCCSSPLSKKKTIDLHYKETNQLIRDGLEEGYNLEEINNKGLKRILGLDVLNIKEKKISLKVNNNNTNFIIKQSELTRRGKLIHKKITLIPDE